MDAKYSYGIDPTKGMREGEMWRLKKSEKEFQVTREGKFEYCFFKHGEVYSSIPAEEASRFEPSEPTPETQKKKKGGEEK